MKEPWSTIVYRYEGTLEYRYEGTLEYNSAQVLRNIGVQ
jgi:hypothetical protein